MIAKIWLALALADCGIAGLWAGNNYHHEANPLMSLAIKNMGVYAYVAAGILLIIIGLVGMRLIGKIKWLQLAFLSLAIIEVPLVIWGIRNLVVWENAPWC